MNDSELKVGDFAKNKIHGYITFLYGFTGEPKEAFNRGSFFAPMFFGMCLKLPNDFRGLPPATYFVEEGEREAEAEMGWRMEIPSELEKVPPTRSLLVAAKAFILLLNTAQKLDNLTYIELLDKLNEKEKNLKDENQL